MQSLTIGNYAADQVKAVLHSPNRKLSFRYDLLDGNNQYKSSLSNVLSASISNDALAEIKRTARFSLRDDGVINYLSDRIKPYARLWMGSEWVGWPLGVFLLSTPSRKTDIAGVVTRDVEAYDQLQVLKDDKATGQYLISAGTNFITAIKSLLDGAGITSQNLTPTSLTLPVDREWDGGTPKLTIINELLSAMNYDSLYFDENGVAIAKPYVSPDQRASEYTYADDDSSVIFPEVEETLDLFSVPNQFVLIVSEPDRAVLKSVYTNSSANSPTSTVSRGRTIVDYQRVDAADQATLDGLAQKAAFNASQVYQTVDMDTAIAPYHSHNDVYTLQFSQLGISAKYEEIGWSFDLKSGSKMSHSIRRIVTV